jgi:hypothetical protein
MSDIVVVLVRSAIVIRPDVNGIRRVLRLDARAVWVTALASSALAASTATAQQPNFAGRWAALPDSAPPGTTASPTPGSPGSGWGTPLTITQDSARVTVEYQYFSRYDLQPPVQLTYALNGAERRNTVMTGIGFQQQLTRAAWNGSTLVLTTVHVIANPAGTGDSLRVEVTRRLSLESPTRLAAETTRAGVLGGAPTTTRTIYTKQ